MASMESRVTSLEEHRRNRDKQDDKMLEIMERIGEDVHTLALRVEKKISFVSGMAFGFSLIGGGLGAIIAIWLKKEGFA